MQNMDILGLFSKISESTTTILQLASRTEERVKALTERNEISEKKIDNIIEGQNKLLIRIVALEGKDVEKLETRIFLLENTVKDLNITVQDSKNKLGSAFDFVYKIVLAIIIGWILWRLGVN